MKRVARRHLLFVHALSSIWLLLSWHENSHGAPGFRESLAMRRALGCPRQKRAAKEDVGCPLACASCLRNAITATLWCTDAKHVMPKYVQDKAHKSMLDAAEQNSVFRDAGEAPCLPLAVLSYTEKMLWFILDAKSWKESFHVLQHVALDRRPGRFLLQARLCSPTSSDTTRDRERSLSSKRSGQSRCCCSASQHFTVLRPARANACT